MGNNSIWLKYIGHSHLSKNNFKKITLSDSWEIFLMHSKEMLIFMSSYYYNKIINNLSIGHLAQVKHCAKKDMYSSPVRTPK